MSGTPSAALEGAMRAVARRGLTLYPGEEEKYAQLAALTRLLLDALSAPSPTRASDSAVQAHALLEASIASNPPPQAPACHKGCGHCCRVYVSATAPEVFAITRALRQLPPEHFATLRERIRKASEATDRDWVNDMFFTHPCPLLEENACTLHSVRPDVCRGVSSYSAKACADSIAALSRHRDEPVPKVAEHGFLRALHSHAVWAALQAAGLPSTGYSLNQALDRVVDMDDAEERWLAGEDVFAGVRQDTSLQGDALAMVSATVQALIAGATGAMPVPSILVGVREIASPLGLLRLRPERPEDEAFRFALFCDARPDLSLLPPPVRADIQRMQFRAQNDGYLRQFPNAVREIVELNAQPIGRVVHDRSGSTLHLIDIAVAPERRSRGAGTAILQDLMGQAAARGVALRLSVASTNPAAHLYRRLGFALVERAATDDIMEWRTSV